MGPFSQEINDEVWDTLYGEGKLPGGPPSLTPLNAEAYLSTADPAVRLLHEHATARGVGEVVEVVDVSFPDGVAATAAVTTGPGGRFGLVVSDPGLPDGGFLMSFDADGILEISNPGFLVRSVPGGEMVEGWEAHCSCKTSHCINAAIGFWFDSWVFVPVFASVLFFCPHCDAGEPEDLNPVNRAACLACVVSLLPVLYALIPVSMASVEECVLNDPCNWCRDDSCGTDEVTGRSCTADFNDMSPGHDFVVLETVDVYYCSHPDEYRRCETRTEFRLVEGCPWGCDYLGSGGACAPPPPSCVPAECELSEPWWPPMPYCELRPEDDTWVLLMDYRERTCQPMQPVGEGCVEERVTRVLEECPFGCADNGLQCADAPACSASGVSPVPVPQDLPAPVAETRRRIIEAAVDCNYDALATLSASASYFAYSLDETGNPAHYWQFLEQGGTGQPLLSLVATLNLQAEAAGVGGTEGGFYLWSDGAGGVTEYRVGISAEGHWLFFLADD